MKKVLLLLLIIFSVGCEKTTNKWPTTDIIEYSKGQIIEINNVENEYEIKIESTKEELNEYIEALKVVTYEEYNAYNTSNINIHTLYNGDKYIKLEYIESNNNSQDINYNVLINIYSNKPEDWK